MLDALWFKFLGWAERIRNEERGDSLVNWVVLAVGLAAAAAAIVALLRPAQLQNRSDRWRTPAGRSSLLHKGLRTHRTFENQQVVLNEKRRYAALLRKPSDGLEPSTPSLHTWTGRRGSIHSGFRAAVRL
jgi:hypothetical protein